MGRFHTRILAALVLAGVLVAGASAQGRPGGGPGGKGHGPRLGQHRPPFADFGKGVLSKLDLSEDQKARIKRIAEPRLQELRELHETPMIPSRRMERSKEIVREMQREIEAVLTPEQLEKMRELLREARQKRWRRGGPPPPPQ
jgi:Spy/CpxP family protein refolding chaperone